MSIPLEVTAYELRQWFHRKLHIAGHRPEVESGAALSPTSYFVSTFFFVLREQLSVALLDLRTANARRKAVNEIAKGDPGFHARLAGIYQASVDLEGVQIPRAQVDLISKHAGDLNTPDAFSLVWTALLSPLPSVDERRVAVAWPLCASPKRRSPSSASPTAPPSAVATAPLLASERQCVTDILSVTSTRYQDALSTCTDAFDKYTQCVNSHPQRAGGCAALDAEVAKCFTSAGITFKRAV